MTCGAICPSVPGGQDPNHQPSSQERWELDARQACFPFLALACNCASLRSEFTPSESFPEEKSPNVVLLVVELVEERCGVKSELGGTRQVVGGDPHHLCTLSLRP